MKRIATLIKDGRVVGLVHGPDAIDQRIRVKGKEWRFDFDEHGGPLWLRKDGAPRQCQNPNKEVWRRWEAWHKRWRAKRGRERPVPAACVRKGETMNGHSFDSTDWLAEPRASAARETQKEPGGERAEFQPTTH